MDLFNFQNIMLPIAVIIAIIMAFIYFVFNDKGWQKDHSLMYWSFVLVAIIVIFLSFGLKSLF